MRDTAAWEGLGQWFQKQCDGDWEHGNEIRIASLDNPGWTISIPIRETHLETVQFERIDEDRPESEWLSCWRTEESWEAVCGPEQLVDAISLFVAWAEEATAK
jgi:hypothetical protein